MASSSIFHIILLILFHLLLASSITDFRAGLTRVSSFKTLPKYASTNPSKNAGHPGRSHTKSPMKGSGDVYLMNLAIGTPPVPFSAIMDTGSDLIWTKCKTISSSARLFDPSKSKTYSKINENCDDFKLYGCEQKYENDKVKVSLGKETLTVGGESIPNVTFGCGTTKNKHLFGGIIGMGPGELSLVSQLKERVFSYCLGSRFDPRTSSVLLAGSKASVLNTGVQTVPLVTYDSNYKIYLKGISVGGTKLPITSSEFAISNRGGGMVIDSGTTFTYLEKSIVDMISNEFVNQTKVEKSEDNVTRYGLQHCFKYQGGYNADNVPNVVFHFDGGNWELGKENYIYEKKGRPEGCLGFIANEKSNKPTIFGNMQQQNMMVIYDLEQKTLSFKRANCNDF